MKRRTSEDARPTTRWVLPSVQSDLFIRITLFKSRANSAIGLTRSKSTRLYRWLLKFLNPFFPKPNSDSSSQKSSKYFPLPLPSSPPFPPVRRFSTKDFSSKYLEYTSRAVSHEFHKVSSVLHVSSEDRSVKIGAIRPRSFGPNRNLRRGIDILGGSYTINPRLAFLARENGVTGMRRPAKSNQLIREELMTGIS